MFQSPGIGSVFRTDAMMHEDQIDYMFQSPGIGSVFRTVDMKSLEPIKIKMFQSPGIGSVFRTLVLGK